MTPEQRVQAVVAEGFSERHARFLVLVLVHAGVFLRRQYAAHEGVRRGRTTEALVSTLRARHLATAYPAHAKAHLYHVHGKALYRAIGEPDSRLRKPVTLGRAIERLMLLDVLVQDTTLRWLGNAAEKVGYFTALTGLRPDELPRLRFGSGAAKKARAFPDRLPIGVTADGRTHVLLYGVTGNDQMAFRAFLHRHHVLLEALSDWEVRLVVPKHLTTAVPHFERVAYEELARPLRLDAIWELHEYFAERQRVERGQAPGDAAAYERQRRTYRAPRFFALYRTWLHEGDAVLDLHASTVLAEAMTRARGRLSTVVLPHTYVHLDGMAGTA